jgi:hypothetical protein
MSLFDLFRRSDPGLVAAGVPRSSGWPAWLKAFLKGKTCVCCGSRGPLTGHHKIPFHLRPDLELVESNVAPICDGTDCHLVIGHLKDFKLYNPDFDADAAQYLKKRMAAIAKQRA